MTEAEFKISEVANKLSLTDKVVKQINEERDTKLLDILRKQLSFAFSENLIFNGKKAIRLSQSESERDISLRATEFINVIDVIDDISYAALLGKMQYRQDRIIDSIIEANNIPLWTIIWRRLKGQPIVERIIK